MEMSLKGIFKVRKSKINFLICKIKIFIIKWKQITQTFEITLNEISLTFTEIHKLRSSKDHKHKCKCRSAQHSTSNREWSKETRFFKVQWWEHRYIMIIPPPTLRYSLKWPMASKHRETLWCLLFDCLQERCVWGLKSQKATTLVLVCCLGFCLSSSFFCVFASSVGLFPSPTNGYYQYHHVPKIQRIPFAFL